MSFHYWKIKKPFVVLFLYVVSDLVKDAALTDELLSGLGVDSHGKTNVWDK